MADKSKPSRTFDLNQAGGLSPIAGMDEAGRGPLAGPVVAACAVMPGEMIEGVNDSKKLTPRRREVLYDTITNSAIAWGVGIVDNETIDRMNILNATREAMERAWQAMESAAPVLLVDSVKGLNIPAKIIPIDHGDALSYSIAAASIIAKVTRDRLMLHLDEAYPQYGFAAHKGYGTQAHIRALEEYGPCPLHRRTFIRNLKPSAALRGEQGEDHAAQFLQARGYAICARRYRVPQGECDIIAQDGDMLVFVEVKTRKPGGIAAPREFVTRQKQSKIIACARAYLHENGWDDALCRFDVIEVIEGDAGRQEINHYKNAFEPQEER